MTDTDTEYVLFGEHPENLESGALIAPGDRVRTGDLGEGDQWLVDEGRLRDVAELEPTKEEIEATEASPALLKGQALDERADELDIAGRSNMTADEKRAAIAERRESNPNPEA
jgi:hypothetical protein